MGIAGTVAKVAAKGAARIGIGAAGGPIGAGIGALMLAFDVVPLIQDLASNGSDPEKIAKVKAARDGMAQKLVQERGIPMDQAIAEVNEQMKPIIQEASQGGGRSAGGTLLDAASLGAGLYLGKKAGVFGKAKGAMKAVEEAEPAAVAAAEAPAAEVAEAAETAPSVDPSLMNGLDELMVKARMREQPGLPAGVSGLDMANAAVMPKGLGTKGMKGAKKRTE